MSDSLAQPEDDLLRHLDHLRSESTRLLDTPLQARGEFHQGFIEMAAPDETGLAWISGWMPRSLPLEFAAVLLDRRKIPAAVALTAYPREDLPPDAHAVVGVLRADWQPSGPDAELFLFFGEGLRLHLRGVTPLQVVGPPDAIRHFEGVRAKCTGALTASLMRLITSAESWVPETGNAAGFPSFAAVDRLLVLPGFGCIAGGWAMSPVKQVARFALRCGGRVLHADPSATYRRPRPDLLESFPGCGGGMTDGAGFVAVFRGPIIAAEFVDPILKVVFADGTSTNHAVPAPVLGRIGHSAMDEVLGLLPSLPYEAFFPEFALAMGRDVAARLGTVDPWRVAPTPHAVVVALPRDRSDLFLVLEEIRHLAGGLPAAAGFVFLAERGAARADALALFVGLSEGLGLGVPMSLFLVDDVEQALHLAGDALAAVGADRFLFVGTGVVLSAEGWRAALAALAAVGPDDPGPRVLRVTSDAVASPRREEDPADVFAWSAERFRAVLPDLPTFLGGRHGDNGFRAAGAVRMGPADDGIAGERTGGGRTGSVLAGRVNAAIATQRQRVAAP